MTEPKCRTCRFWKFNDDGGDIATGWCRRFPPTVDAREFSEEIDGLERWGFWPLTTSDDWCGEHKEAAER